MAWLWKDVIEKRVEIWCGAVVPGGKLWRIIERDCGQTLGEIDDTIFDNHQFFFFFELVIDNPLRGNDNIE